MTKELDIETYLIISSSGYEINLFNPINFKSLYEKKFEFENKVYSVDFNILNTFLEENIFKIEKLIGRFIKNITLILESDKILNINIGITKKNYNESLNAKYFESMLVEIKDIFKERYQDQNIMHIIIDRYLVDGIDYQSFKDILKGDQVCLEAQLIAIPNTLSLELDNVLKKYHIKIIRIMDKNYIKNFFKDENKKFSKMAFQIQSGLNPHEVKIVPKNRAKIGFFEKFFQLFS
tara:strand:- start:358 stop:1062 length:705 start_codon:yes stop_codon:yes gene_type:complete